MNHHIVLATTLNVRALPRATADSTILGVLPLGSVVEELDADADRSWLRVRQGTLEGWMSNTYLLREDALRGFPWVDKAAREFGVAEIPGPRNNPRIQDYLATVGVGDASESTSWCSAFAKWCVMQAQAHSTAVPGVKKITSGARSWHTSAWGADLTASAPLGAVVVLWRRRGPDEDDPKDATRTPEQVKKDGTGGHVGFLAEPFRASDAQVTLLGGNQGNRVGKSRYALGTNYGLMSMRGLP